MADISDTIHNIRMYLDGITQPGNIFSALGPFLGGGGMAAINGASQGDILNTHVPQMSPVAPQAPTSTPQGPTPSPAPPISGPQSGLTFPQAPQAPQPPISGPQSGLPYSPQMPMAPQVPMPRPRPQIGPGAPMQIHPPMPQASVPMPQSRPQAAPQGAPSGMGFFQRNAAMMRDPATGDFIDPAAAAQATKNISGPDLVQKFMNYLHRDTA